MQPNTPSGSRPPYPPNTSSIRRPHEVWPQSLGAQGLAFNELQNYLLEHPGNACRMSKFAFGDGVGDLLWRKSIEISDVGALETEVQKPVSCSMFQGKVCFSC